MKSKLEENSARIIQLSDLVEAGEWTTYGAIAKIVYGSRRLGRNVGRVMRAKGLPGSAHRILRAGGKISPDWRLNGLGPEECERRLREEGVWDAKHNRARADRELDVAAFRKLAK